ncbi:MAG TPA: DNA repair and recombination protein RadB [Methanothermococcus okinawensis]|uniref:DNA repair and recombination protein RadB n=1 Tax=Methanofervidicoccus abyssi TaxID=2082189 RepID=A0A401HQL1_9EURY|nr:DNA repair and recombination protein RadB [Methanofervidicoccus abyssi]GBF36482.1 DNA repair protein RadB [Methanofervidicoccus abyssi]HIP34935.1 DNA repair and recombination protein RadB [Methanothermococcus okinawensis]
MLSDILRGNIEKKTITQIYGPPGVGKTNIAIISMVYFVRRGYRVVYVDTEGGLSVERIRQISGRDFEKVLENLTLYEPETFEEQSKVLEKLFYIKNIGLVIIDGISSLYRLELSDDVHRNALLNRILGKQILTLLKLAKKKNVAVLLTNQISDTYTGVKPIGGIVLEYWSKTIVRMERINEIREAILEKHRYIKEGERVKFRIVNEGIEILKR